MKRTTIEKTIVTGWLLIAAFLLFGIVPAAIHTEMEFRRIMRDRDKILEERRRILGAEQLNTQSPRQP